MDVGRLDIAALGQILNERAGLKLQSDGEFGLELALRSRLQSLGMSNSAAYIERVRGPDGDVELHRLLPLVTVGKTDFFRDERQFAAMSGSLLPERLDVARRERRPVRIWSAGCATGEEPYSLAICCIESGALPAEIDLLATDINGEAIYEAERAVYALRKLRPVGADRLRRFFVPEGGDAARASDELRRLVRFQVFNLAEPPFPTPAGGFDVIFCRNVMIYFDIASVIRTLDRFYEALAPGGYLALGYSESLYRLYGRFELTDVRGSFLYRKPIPAEVVSASRPTSRNLTPAFGSALPRVAKPTPVVPLPAVVPRKPPTPLSTPVVPLSEVRLVPALQPEAPHRFARSVELVEQGHFHEAVDLLRALVAAEPQSLVGWITLGNVLTVMRRFPEAYVAYDEALSIEPLSSEARLFLGIALCEGRQPLDGTRELSRALFLDADLALAHYYLGRAAEELGDRATARRAYRNCLSLCQSGNPARPNLAHYPDLPKDPEVLGRAAQYALSAGESGYT